MSWRRSTSAPPPPSARCWSARRTAERWAASDRLMSPGVTFFEGAGAVGRDRRRQHRAAASTERARRGRRRGGRCRRGQRAGARSRPEPALLAGAGVAAGAGCRRAPAWLRAARAVPELPPVPAPCAYATSPSSKPARANERNASLIDVCPSKARVGMADRIPPRRGGTSTNLHETFRKIRTPPAMGPQCPELEVGCQARSSRASEPQQHLDCSRQDRYQRRAVGAVFRGFVVRRFRSFGRLLFPSTSSFWSDR